MQSRIWKYRSVAIAGALGFALVAGAGNAVAQTGGANPAGSNKGVVMGGGAPTILKDEPRWPTTQDQASQGSSANITKPPRSSENFKVEIEGVTSQPNAKPR